jgi:hypothetical protein
VSWIGEAIGEVVGAMLTEGVKLTLRENEEDGRKKERRLVSERLKARVALDKARKAARKGDKAGAIRILQDECDRWNDQDAAWGDEIASESREKVHRKLAELEGRLVTEPEPEPEPETELDLDDDPWDDENGFGN